jgi:hypothetical protein
VAVHDEQAEVATVELTGSGVDVLLPPPAPPAARDGGARGLVAVLLAVGALLVGAQQLVGLGGVDLLPSVAPATRILPAGPPQPQTMARQGDVVMLVPVQQRRITEILFHPVAGASALPLEPVGRAADEGPIGWIAALFAGEDSGGPRYRIDGEPTSVDVGAPVGTDVYAPVEGRIVSVAPLILEGIPYGEQIAIEPVANPGVVVLVSGVEAEEGLSVGSPVSTRADAWTRLGRVVDVTEVLEPALARYTQDGGNRAQIEVRPASAVAAS